MKAVNPLGFGKPPPKDIARDIHIHGGCPAGYFNGDFVPALAALGYNDQQGLDSLWFPQAGRAGPSASKARPNGGPSATGRLPTSNPHGLEAGRPVTAGRVPRLEMAPEEALNAEEYKVLQEVAADYNGDHDDALLIFPPLRQKLQSGPKLPPQLAHSAAVAAALGKRSIGGGSGRLPFSLSMGAQGADLRLVMEVEALEDMERRVKEEEEALERAAQQEAERRYQQRLTHQLQRHRMGVSAAEAAEYDARISEYIGSGPPTRSQYKAQLEQQKKEAKDKKKGGKSTTAPQTAGGISKKALAEAEREESLEREAAARKIQSGVRGALQGRRTTVIIDAIRDREVAAASGLAEELLAVEADFDVTQDFYGAASPSSSSPLAQTQRPGVLNLRGGASSVSSLQTPDDLQAWNLGRWRHRWARRKDENDDSHFAHNGYQLGSGTMSCRSEPLSASATHRTNDPCEQTHVTIGMNRTTTTPSEHSNFAPSTNRISDLAAESTDFGGASSPVLPSKGSQAEGDVGDANLNGRGDTPAWEPLLSVVELKRRQKAEIQSQISGLREECARLDSQLRHRGELCRSCDVSADTLSCTLEALRKVCEVSVDLQNAEEREGGGGGGLKALQSLANILAATQSSIRGFGGKEDYEVGQLAAYLQGLL